MAERESLSDRIDNKIRSVSERVFKWSDKDREASARYQEQRASEARKTMAGPRMFKFDLSGRIAAHEKEAARQRARLKSRKATRD